jgi:DNA-directed RNA polymerase sigma subunit (sigma70/sigma32)
MDDLIQEGQVGLIWAVADYDAARGTTFTGFASGCIRNAIRRALRRESRVARSMNPIPPGHDAPASTGPAPPGPDDLAAGFRHLSALEAWVIRERYGIGVPPRADSTRSGARRTQADLAAERGWTKPYIHLIERGALEKLRRTVDPELSAA